MWQKAVDPYLSFYISTSPEAQVLRKNVEGEKCIYRHFCELCLVLGQTVHCVWIFFFFTVSTFFNEVKVFSVSSQQACTSLQKFVMKGRTFINLTFFLEE